MFKYLQTHFLSLNTIQHPTVTSMTSHQKPNRQLPLTRKETIHSINVKNRPPNTWGRPEVTCFRTYLKQTTLYCDRRRSNSMVVMLEVLEIGICVSCQLEQTHAVPHFLYLLSNKSPLFISFSLHFIFCLPKLYTDPNFIIHQIIAF